MSYAPNPNLNGNTPINPPNGNADANEKLVKDPKGEQETKGVDPTKGAVEKTGAKKTKGTIETEGTKTEGVDETKSANGKKGRVKTKLTDEKEGADETKIANEKRVVDLTKVGNDNDIKKPNTNTKPIPNTESQQKLSQDSPNATSTIPANNNKMAGMDMVMDMEMDMEMEMETDMNRSSPSCTRHFQWRVPNDNITFMLNADVALFKNIQVTQLAFISSVFVTIYNATGCLIKADADAACAIFQACCAYFLPLYSTRRELFFFAFRCEN